jgi:hypothetical protein
MSALSSFGITQPVLILCVLGFVAAGVIGYFWQYIVPGVIILGVVTLFYVAPEAEVKTEAKHEKEEVFDEYQAYMKDCMEIAQYSMFECKKLWNNRETEVEAENDEFQPADKVKLLDVNNKEYKKRRAAALSKKDAVVLQTTFR